MVSKLMSPNYNPAESGVRRVNNLPLILGGCVAALAIIVVMSIAFSKAEKQRTSGKSAGDILIPVSSAVSIADEMTRGKEKGIAGAEFGSIPGDGGDNPATNPSDGFLGFGTNRNPGGSAQNIGNQSYAPPGSINGELQSPNTGQPHLSASPQDAVTERVAMMQLQAFEEALRAKTAVSNFSGGYGRAGTVRENLNEVRQRINSVSLESEDPQSAYQSRLAQVQSMVSGMTGSGSAGQSAIRSGDRTENADIGDGVNRWTLTARVEAPPTPYVLLAGSVIPGILTTAINSELPGQIIAQVANNVYDSATGNHLLIPQGSQLLGSYSSDVAFGQSRALVAWHRINYPDGKWLDIGSMSGADGAGASGYRDRLNTHFWKMFRSSLLMSAIVAGVNMSQDSGSSNGRDGLSDRRRSSDAMSEALGQQLGQTMSQMIMKNMNVSPTIEIRAGYRFNIMVSRDIVLHAPYRAFDYNE